MPGIDKQTVIFRWADREGLLLKHKALNAEQILALYGKACVLDERSAWGWAIVDVAQCAPVRSGRKPDLVTLRSQSRV